MRTPYTNVWDRANQCLHFWDGRTVQGDLQVSGNAWTFRPARTLTSGAVFIAVLPLRRLQVSRIEREGQSYWLIDIVGTAAHPQGAMGVTDWYIDITVEEGGPYRIENLGEFADAMHQRWLTETQVIQALRALEVVCEGLHRTRSSVPSLLEMWDLRVQSN